MELYVFQIIAAVSWLGFVACLVFGARGLSTNKPLRFLACSIGSILLGIVGTLAVIEILKILITS